MQIIFIWFALDLIINLFISLGFLQHHILWILFINVLFLTNSKSLSYKVNDNSSNNQTKTYNNPCKLIGEKVCSFIQQLILPINVLAISTCNQLVITIDVEESSVSHRFKGKRAHIEAIKLSQKNIQLLGEVNINEYKYWNLLNIFNCF